VQWGSKLHMDTLHIYRTWSKNQVVKMFKVSILEVLIGNALWLMHKPPKKHTPNPSTSYQELKKLMWI
jgi:ssDNA-specific exonuclease RecJ